MKNRIMLLMSGSLLPANAEAAGMNEVEVVGEGDIANLEEVVAPTIDPKNCFNDAEAGKNFLSLIDWSKSEEREGQRGKYNTTTAHNITLEDSKFTYQIQMSCNRRARKEKTPEGLSASDARKIAEAQKIMTAHAKRIGKDVDEVALDLLTKK